MGSGYDIPLAQATVVHSICVVISKHYKVLQCLQGVLESSVATPGPVIGTWAGNSGGQSYWCIYTQMQGPAAGDCVLLGFGRRYPCSGRGQGCKSWGHLHAHWWLWGPLLSECIVMAARSYHKHMVVEACNRGQAWSRLMYSFAWVANCNEQSSAGQWQKTGPDQSLQASVGALTLVYSPMMA